MVHNMNNELTYKKTNIFEQNNDTSEIFNACNNYIEFLNECKTERKCVEFFASKAIENGYKPIDQITGYLVTGDPTYISTKENARSMIRKFDPDELIEEILTEYFKLE
jgi:uncharacterized protein (UPF0297 family)